MIILEERVTNDTKGGSSSTNQLNKTSCGDAFVKTESEKDGESNLSRNNGSPIANCSPSRYPPISIVFVLFWTIGIVLLIGEFFNVFGNDNGVLLSVLCWKPNCRSGSRCPRNKFSNSGVLLQENNILECIFGIRCNIISINISRYFELLFPTLTPGCKHESRIVFNKNVILKAGIDIVDCIFGIGLCDNHNNNDNNNEYAICNGMFWYFYFYFYFYFYPCAKHLES